MRLSTRRPTIISPTIHIRSFKFRPFLALIVTGSLLSFLSSYINTICIISLFQTSIAGFTGTTSRMLIELAQLNLWKAFHYSLLVICFILGSFSSAALIGGSSFRIQRSYGVVLIIESFALSFGYLFEVNSKKFISNLERFIKLI